MTMAPAEARELSAQRLAAAGLLDDENVTAGVHCARSAELKGVWLFLAEEPCCQAPRERLVLRVRLEGVPLVKTLAHTMDGIVDAAPCRMELLNLLVQKACTACERGELHLQSDGVPSALRRAMRVAQRKSHAK